MKHGIYGSLRRILKSDVSSRLMSCKGGDKGGIPEVPLGQPGSGAGQGGGAGGSIREAGGEWGRRGAVKEERYFRQKGKEQVEELKKTMGKRKKCERSKAQGETLEEKRRRNAELAEQFKKKK